MQVNKLPVWLATRPETCPYTPDFITHDHPRTPHDMLAELRKLSANIAWGDRPFLMDASLVSEATGCV